MTSAEDRARTAVEFAADTLREKRATLWAEIDSLSAQQDVLDKKVDVLEDRVAFLTRAIGALEKAATEELPTLAEYVPQADKVEFIEREFLAERVMSSQTEAGASYLVRAYLERGEVVYTCTCPAYRYSKVDELSGQRERCKHIKRAICVDGFGRTVSNIVEARSRS